MSVQIFLSYARRDDLLPPHMSAGKGFVTCLREQLLYEFGQRGAPEPTIWRDNRSIERGDQFDPIIRTALQNSAILLVVLSPNWMNRPYCKQELDLFMERWRHEGELGVRQRIVVACKSYVDFERRPSLLQGQEGYDFFRFEGADRTGEQIDFFARGEIRDPQYHATIEELAGFLYRRAQHLTRRDVHTGDIDRREEEFVRGRHRPRPAAPPSDEQARKIFLAKPASDMQSAYLRLVEELSHNGYAVVPDPAKDIPYDTSANGFIDAALAEASLSIHLIGEGKGYTPENSQPIVPLQLARAALRVSAAAGGNGAKTAFRRIIWAPAIADTADPSASSANGGDASDTQAASQRPDQLLKDFGEFMPGDKVIGGTASRFVDFVIEHLRQSDTQTPIAAEPSADDWVYVYHVAEDTQYACDLVEALRKHGIAANPPALEGDAAELIRIHRQQLAECSAVVLCWARATEAWAHAHAHELKDWTKLGRQKKFRYRGLLAGPPPGVRKSVFVKFPPTNEIDIVVNLTEEQRPLADAIDSFIKQAAAPAR